ncbi:aconitase X [Hyphococcus lacteus]|uniref:Aconitase X catalytic domain-containing protein n=1 Tax=Hyphococcus lacteus TaxID=3143536 RepID=A0ABV3YZG5_9PROT
MLTLTEEDRSILGGEFGPMAARAMKILVRYGEATGATEFVSIRSAHIDGCLYHGPSSIDFAQSFVKLGGLVRVPTTLNVAAADVTHPEWHCGDPSTLNEQKKLTDFYTQIGCIPSLTCAPYQRLVRPQFGDHIAWAESNAIVFANSILGARTDRYGDFADLCAALTGRVPLVGLHRDENRHPELLVTVPKVSETKLPRDLYFGATGYLLGLCAKGKIPYVRGLPEDASEDELKALGAAGASSGSLALFHAEHLTPETHDINASHLPHLEFSSDELGAVIDDHCSAKTGDPVAAICLGTPHYSKDEFIRLSDTIIGRKKAPSVDFYVSTSREIAEHINTHSRFAPLREFGVRLIVDTCTYLAPVVDRRDGYILTTSAKYAHYGPGNLNRRIALMTLERCINAAVAGKVAPC